MGRVLEAVHAPAEAGRPAEVVDGDGVYAVLGEAQGQVLVVGVQAADIRQDHDAGAGRDGGAGTERGQPSAIVRGEGQLAGVERTTGDRRHGRAGVMVVAHGTNLRRRAPLCAAGRVRDRPRASVQGGVRIGPENDERQHENENHLRKTEIHGSMILRRWVASNATARRAVSRTCLAAFAAFFAVFAVKILTAKGAKEPLDQSNAPLPGGRPQRGLGSVRNTSVPLHRRSTSRHPTG